MGDYIILYFITLEKINSIKTIDLNKKINVVVKINNSIWFCLRSLNVSGKQQILFE